MDRGDIDRALALEPRILHLSGITLALSMTCADAIRYALEVAPRASFDVNYRPALWPSREVAASELRLAADAADIVFVGLDEAEVLWGTTDAAAVRELIPDPEYLVVKNADVEATSFGPAGATTVAARVVDVVEPVGAGDAFASGWLFAHLAGLDETQALTAGHLVAGSVLLSPTDGPLPGARPITLEQVVDVAVR
jgi:2-dehydro-3-deoxygluconokinase